MPNKTADQLREKATALRKKLAETREPLDGKGVRRLKKRIRRAQRRARVLTTASAPSKPEAAD